VEEKCNSYKFNLKQLEGLVLTSKPFQVLQIQLERSNEQF